MGSAGIRKLSEKKRSPFLNLFITFPAAVLLYFIVRLCNRTFDFSTVLSDQSVWHHGLLIFSVVISFAIFLLAFYSYPQIKNIRMMVTGCTLLAVGLLDGFQVLNFSGVFFRPEVWENMTTLVWLITRLYNAVGFSFVAVSGERQDKTFRRRYFVLISLIAAVSAFCFVGFDPFHLIVFEKGKGLTSIGLVFIFVIALIYVWNLAQAAMQYKRTKDYLYTVLACTFLLMLFSDLSVIGIDKFHTMQNYLGHFYQFVAYAILFNVFFVHGIQRPYFLLSKAKEDLNAYLSELDELVDQRTNELRCINEKLLADQEVARGMQLSMLPASLPQNDYVTFSSGYVPADNLSGDFYNVFKIDETCYGICIGDVSGHGVSAAMLSIFTFQKMQSLMEETGGEGMSIPSMVLKQLYDSFNAANFNEDLYLVMLYGVFNTETGIFSYASGGLNTVPLRVRPDGSIQELDNDGFAICKLGTLIRPKFTNHQVLLFPGDKLLLYTDGLVDARSPESHEPYSMERLKQVILKNYKWDVDYFSKAILEDVESFASDKPSDDITFLVLDILPPF